MKSGILRKNSKCIILSILSRGIVKIIAISPLTLGIYMWMLLSGGAFKNSVTSVEEEQRPSVPLRQLGWLQAWFSPPK